MLDFGGDTSGKPNFSFKGQVRLGPLIRGEGLRVIGVRARKRLQTFRSHFVFPPVFGADLPKLLRVLCSGRSWSI